MSEKFPRLRKTAGIATLSGGLLLAASCAESQPSPQDRVINEIKAGKAVAVPVMVRLNGEANYRHEPTIDNSEGIGNKAGTVNGSLPIVIDKPVRVTVNGDTWYGFKNPKEDEESAVIVTPENIEDELVFVNATQLEGETNDSGEAILEEVPYGARKGQTINASFGDNQLIGITSQGEQMPVGEARIVTPAEADFFMQSAVSSAGGK